MKDMKKFLFILILLIIGGYIFFHGIAGFGPFFGDNASHRSVLSSTSDIALHDTDGRGTNYAFTYDGETFYPIYLYGCWKVYDSYKITNKHDQKIICQALIDEHPVHGKDMVSYRTADDMAYEWQQHNLAYKYLPEGNAWRVHAANVDLDPYDQGRSFEEIYEDRTGQEFDLKEKVKESLDDGTFFEKVKRYVFD